MKRMSQQYMGHDYQSRFSTKNFRVTYDCCDRCAGALHIVWTIWGDNFVGGLLCPDSRDETQDYSECSFKDHANKKTLFGETLFPLVSCAAVIK